MFKQLREAPTVSISIDDTAVTVPAGVTVAAAILLHDLNYCRTTPVSGAYRSVYCMMGVCYECLMEIDGVSNCQACLITVVDGMEICREVGASGTKP